MAVSAKQVKELREKTGAGMMDCKEALTETDGDMDNAMEYLREKGMAKAAKKADRIAAEGLAHIEINGNSAVILEVNCETDFVTKNEQFKQLISEIGSHIIQNKPANVEEALQQQFNEEGETLDKYISAAVGKIGEKITLRRFVLMNKTDNDIFGAYLHMGGSIGALTLINDSQDEQLAKDIAMHIAAVNPSYLSKDDVPEQEAEHEREILRKQALDEGKPEHIVEKMVDGRMGKFYEENCLLEQDFVKDPDQKVKDYIASKNASVNTFTRYGVGEGIEKEEESFAEEVKNQMKQ